MVTVPARCGYETRFCQGLLAGGRIGSPLQGRAAAHLSREGQDLARDAVGERLPGGPHGRYRRSAAHDNLQTQAAYISRNEASTHQARHRCSVSGGARSWQGQQAPRATAFPSQQSLGPVIQTPAAVK